MKLYAWQPKGHGEESFFVMAENEEDARKFVEDKIQKGWYYSDEDICFQDMRVSYCTDGWGTDYYHLTVCDVGQVITNAND